jgi:hypothetical protein
VTSSSYYSRMPTVTQRAPDSCDKNITFGKRQRADRGLRAEIERRRNVKELGANSLAGGKGASPKQDGCIKLSDAAWVSERIESFTESTVLASASPAGSQARVICSTWWWDLSETTRPGLTTHDHDSTTAAAADSMLLDCLGRIAREQHTSTTRGNVRERPLTVCWQDRERT